MIKSYPKLYSKTSSLLQSGYKNSLMYVHNQEKMYYKRTNTIYAMSDFDGTILRSKTEDGSGE